MEEFVPLQAQYMKRSNLNAEEITSLFQKRNELLTQFDKQRSEEEKTSNLEQEAYTRALLDFWGYLQSLLDPSCISTFEMGQTALLALELEIDELWDLCSRSTDFKRFQESDVNRYLLPCLAYRWAAPFLCLYYSTTN